MKIAFHHSDKPREIQLARHFADGARAYGHEVELRALGLEQTIGECDLAIMVGVKSRDLWNASRAAGAQTLMLDKGYSRHRAGPTWEYWRVSLNAHNPTQTTLMLRDMPSDRFEAMDWMVRPWRERDKRSAIVIAGSSAKYHEFYDLPDPTEYWNDMVRRIKALTKRPIIYRPKPSWRDALPIGGTVYSTRPDHLSTALEGAHCLITHGSNACFDAVAMGIPAIVLGDGVAAPISLTSLGLLHKPLCVENETRLQWLANLAYHQWTESEFASGEAWQTIGGWMDA